MTWSLCAAGAALLLMELNAGLHYFQVGLQQNMGNLGWVPALGMITLRLAQQSVWHWGTVSLALLAAPTTALGLLLVAFGLMVQKQSSGKSR
jgi:hypothetical protein